MMNQAHDLTDYSTVRDPRELLMELEAQERAAFPVVPEDEEEFWKSMGATNTTSEDKLPW